MKVFWLSLLVGFLVSCDATRKQGEQEVETPVVYDEATACLLSQIAYCTNPTQSLEKYLPGWNVAWEASEVNGNHSIVATDGKGYALAIRGSLIDFSWSAFQNWIYQDLNVTTLQNWKFTNDSSKAKVSQGSWDGWQNMLSMKDRSTGQTLLAFLETRINTKTPLLITGHSLGGNLATVFGSYAWQYFRNNGRQRENINIITFAAPAAGNKAFAEDFNKKFPQSLRFENSNDIVPKFPCANKVAALGKLYNASEIMVGYNSLTVSLSRVFTLLNTALAFLEFTNGNAAYTQTNGEGRVIEIPLSGANGSADIASWLSEAGFQHGIARYAAALKVPVVACSP